MMPNYKQKKSFTIPMNVLGNNELQQFCLSSEETLIKLLSYENLIMTLSYALQHVTLS